MSLSEFNDQIVPLLNLGFSATGLLSLIVLIYQYAKDKKWNRLQSHFNFIDIDAGAGIQAEVYALLEKQGAYTFPEQCTPLSEDDVQRLCADRYSVFILNTFINHLHNICTALKFGLVGEEVFQSIHAGRICWWYQILAPYVERRRDEYNNPLIWKEFEVIAVTYINKGAHFSYQRRERVD